MRSLPLDTVRTTSVNRPFYARFDQCFLNASNKLLYLSQSQASRDPWSLEVRHLSRVFGTPTLVDARSKFRRQWV